jgi:hypothetical protein
VGPVARFCDWLSATAVSQLFQSVGWIVPTVQSVHIMAIGMVMASAILLDLRVLSVGRRNRTIPQLFASLTPVIWWALLTLLLSGGMLIVAEPRRELLNVVFRTKMALLVAAVSVTAGLQRWAAINTPSPPITLPRPGVRAAALLSLLLWIAIVGCGRWIAYVEHG